MSGSYSENSEERLKRASRNGRPTILVVGCGGAGCNTITRVPPQTLPQYSFLIIPLRIDSVLSQLGESEDFTAGKQYCANAFQIVT